MAAGHIGFGPGLVDEYQAPRVKPALMHLPSGCGASSGTRGSHLKKILHASPF
jgi:hypothetical protein